MSTRVASKQHRFGRSRQARAGRSFLRAVLATGVLVAVVVAILGAQM